MNVGIDARLLAHDIIGIGRYTAEVTKELVKLDERYFLYTPTPIVVGNWDEENVTVRASKLASRAGKMAWSQTYLPYWAGKDQVDVFWGTTHRIPRLLPKSAARVVTIHDLVWKHAGETMRPLSRWLERHLMPNAIRLSDRVIANSHNTARAIAEQFPWASERIRVVPLGATRLPPPEPRQSLARFGIDRDYFLFVGTLEPRKNLRRLLLAYASLDEAVRRYAMLVIAGGKGWGNDDVGRLIGELGLENSVRLTGYVDERTLATLYHHALFLAMPSIYEGFGLPIVEAMSFGIPVLTSDGSSLPEVAGRAGILVDPLDTDSIAAGLRTMLLDAGLRQRLASHAKPTASQFTWAKAAEATMRIFEEAVEVRKMSRGGRER